MKLRVYLGLVMLIGLLALAACGPTPATPTSIPPVASSTTAPQPSATSAPAIEPTTTMVVPTATTAPPTATVPVPTATTGVTPSPSTGGTAMIEYTRTGGYIGESIAVQINPDGTATLRDLRQGGDPISFTISADLWAQLQAGVAAVHWPSLDAEYLNPNVADGYDYMVTYSAIGVSKSVHSQTAANVPAEFDALLSLLNSVVTEGRGAAPTPTGGPARATLIYRVTGGIAGNQTYVYLSPDGIATISTNLLPNVALVQPSQSILEDAWNAAEAIDWANVDKVYAPQAAPADSMTQEVIYLTANEGHTVSVSSGADFPQAVSTLLLALNTLVSEARVRASAGADITPVAGQTMRYLDFSSVGGIAGLSTRVVVLEDGTAWVSSNRPVLDRRYTLSTDLLDQISSNSTALEWSALAPAYAPANPVSDSIYTRMTYFGTNGGYTVTTSTAADVPDALSALMSLMQQAAAEGRQ